MIINKTNKIKSKEQNKNKLTKTASAEVLWIFQELADYLIRYQKASCGDTQRKYILFKSKILAFFSCPTYDNQRSYISMIWLGGILMLV